MLNEQEQATAHIAIDAVAARGADAIKRAPGPGQAIDFVKSLHASIDKVVKGRRPEDPAPACKPGCSACCSAKVEITDPEALLIARHLGDLPPARRDELIEALRRQSIARAEAPIAQRMVCAFLQASLCSIYEVRPSTCRKAHSLSLQACENHEPLIPQNLEVSLQCDVLMAGTNRAFHACNLPAAKSELTAAVFAALSIDNAAECWFSGQPLIPPLTTSV